MRVQTQTFPWLAGPVQAMLRVLPLLLVPCGGFAAMDVVGDVYLARQVCAGRSALVQFPGMQKEVSWVLHRWEEHRLVWALVSAHERSCKSPIRAALVINSEILSTCSAAPSTPVAQFSHQQHSRPLAILAQLCFATNSGLLQVRKLKSWACFPAMQSEFCKGAVASCSQPTAAGVGSARLQFCSVSSAASFPSPLGTFLGKTTCLLLGMAGVREGWELGGSF